MERSIFAGLLAWFLFCSSLAQVERTREGKLRFEDTGQVRLRDHHHEQLGRGLYQKVTMPSSALGCGLCSQNPLGQEPGFALRDVVRDIGTEACEPQRQIRRSQERNPTPQPPPIVQVRGQQMAG